MTSLHVRAADCPERSARILLDRFAGDLARTERHIVDVQLAAASAATAGGGGADDGNRARAQRSGADRGRLIGRLRWRGAAKKRRRRGVTLPRSRYTR
jgi:hypothetical protein